MLAVKENNSSQWGDVIKFSLPICYLGGWPRPRGISGLIWPKWFPIINKAISFHQLFKSCIFHY